MTSAESVQGMMREAGFNRIKIMRLAGLVADVVSKPGRPYLEAEVHFTDGSVAVAPSNGSLWHVTVATHNPVIL